MAATAGLEVRLALVGAWRLALGDRQGLAWFDLSQEGFWRSFRAAVLGYPLYLILLLLLIGDAEWQRSGSFRVLAVETIDYVIGWVAFPLAMLPITRRLGREHRFFAFMTVYNWCQLPELMLFVLVGLEGAAGLLPSGVEQLVPLAAAAAVAVYEWFIARVALETTRTAAIAVVLVGFVLRLIVSQTAEMLY
jgi:hypothetical protein